MDEKDYREEEENLEETKELENLKQWSEEQTEPIETLFQEDFDENMEDSELVFKTKMKTEEEMKQKQKMSWIQKLKNWWQSLSKRNKIFLLSGVVLGILLLISLIVLFVVIFKKAEPVIPEPDVILEMDNYRYENGKLIFLDEEQELGSYECQNKDENLCGVAIIKTDDAMDTIRRVNENNETLDFHSKIYLDRYVFIKDGKDDEIKLYDIETEDVLDTASEVFQTLDYDGYFILKNSSNKYQLISFKEEMKKLVNYESAYDEIHMVPGSSEPAMIMVRQNNNSYLANLENKILTKAIRNTIVGANKNYIKAKDAEDRYHIYDYNGKEIDGDFEKDYVYLLDDYFISVLANFVTIKDYEGFVMSLEDITLKNSYYNEVDIIKNNQVSKKQIALDYQVNDHLLNLNVHNGEDIKNYSIDLYEGKFSKQLAYMNYFNGVLYFYSDVKKTDLLGSYRCTNRNEVGEDTTTLSTCKPAVDSVYRQIKGNTKEQEEGNAGVIPLFNKEFVFLQDGETILLIDLASEKKEVARYEGVDTTTYTGTMELSFASISDLNFIAKSKSSGKFGVAKITESGIQPVISFNKDEILLLGDYYVVKENNSYALYNFKGEKVSDDRVAPIVDYHEGYMKTLDGTNYFVYPMKGSIVTEKGFDYIELYDKYYAAVIQGRVHVYSYQDEKAEKELLVTEEKEEGVELLIQNYYDTMGKVLAFQIRFENQMIYVKLGGLDGNYSKEIGYTIPNSLYEDDDV